MAIVRVRAADLPPVTAADLAASDALTPEQIEQNAIDDPDNPPLTDDELERGALGRAVRMTRQATGLTQRAFAERYRINIRRLQDIEIGRNKPDSAFMAYMQVIRANPGLVAEALGEPA